MNHNHDDGEKFGEKRPDQGVYGLGKDEFGNDKRPPMDLKPIQFKKTCECKDHTQLSFNIEMDVVAVNAFEAMMMIARGEQPPMAKQWVEAARVMSQYN